MLLCLFSYVNRNVNIYLILDCFSSLSQHTLCVYIYILYIYIKCMEQMLWVYQSRSILDEEMKQLVSWQTISPHLQRSFLSDPLLTSCGMVWPEESRAPMGSNVPPWAVTCQPPQGCWSAGRDCSQLLARRLLPDEEDVHFAQTFQWLTDLRLVVLAAVI